MQTEYRRNQRLYERQEQRKTIIAIAAYCAIVLGLVAILVWLTGCTHTTEMAIKRNADGSSIKIANTRSTLFYDQDESSGFSADGMSGWRDVHTAGDSAVAAIDDLTSAGIVAGEAYLRTQGAP